MLASLDCRASGGKSALPKPQPWVVDPVVTRRITHDKIWRLEAKPSRSSRVSLKGCFPATVRCSQQLRTFLYLDKLDAGKARYTSTDSDISTAKEIDISSGCQLKICFGSFTPKPSRNLSSHRPMSTRMATQRARTNHVGPAAHAEAGKDIGLLRARCCLSLRPLLVGVFKRAAPV